MLDLLWCAQQSGRSFADAALVYSTVTEQLMLDALIRRCRDTEPRNRWDGELLVGTEGDIRGSAAGLTMQILAQDQATEPQVIAFLQQAIALDRWRTGVAELIQRAPEVSSLAVLARQLQGFARV
jgi:NAD-specific glutamate dehydrogenase